MTDRIDMNDDDERRLRLRNGSPLRSYLELMRLPNVFTAMADVAMGFLFVQPTDWQWDPWRRLVDAGRCWWPRRACSTSPAWCSTTCSTWRSTAGSGPSGRCPRAGSRSRRPGGSAGGCWCSARAGRRRAVGRRLSSRAICGRAPSAAAAGRLHPALRRLAEADAAGPAGDGRLPHAQRAAGHERGRRAVCTPSIGWWPAASASTSPASPGSPDAKRDESSRAATGAGHAGDGPGHRHAGLASPAGRERRHRRDVRLEPRRWYLLTGVLGLLIVWRCLWAIVEPTPARVRMAVAQCMLSIVMLDAVACYAVRGVFWAVHDPAALAAGHVLGGGSR